MLELGGLDFASPWLLLALTALPALWWLVRVTPPSPRMVSFPPVRLLMALRPNEETPSKTPWWLILLRMLLAALVILALAHPVLKMHLQIPPLTTFYLKSLVSLWYSNVVPPLAQPTAFALA